MPQEGEGEGAGREVLRLSVLHVVGNEQKDDEEDEDRLQGDAVPEEAQHGWMVGLRRDVFRSRSGQIKLTVHHEFPRDRGRGAMCWHSCGCKHKTAWSSFC